MVLQNNSGCLYIDQDYRALDTGLSVVEYIRRSNRKNLSESFINTELHRYLFPVGTWQKKCDVLSGEERMRLLLCGLEVSESAPEIIILDEPTNNLDIDSLEVLVSAIKNYHGTLLVVSHDSSFLDEIGVESQIELPPRK